MCSHFYWTARLFADDQPVQSKYFASQAERDTFVLEHPEWKKRGKICAENLEKHLENEQPIQNALKIIESSIVNCEKVQPKLKPGSPSLSLSKNRIKALHISRTLLMGVNHSYSTEELEQAVVQITSIKNKSTTGLGNAKEGSSTYTRFSRLISAMDLILVYLQKAIEKE